MWGVAVVMFEKDMCVFVVKCLFEVRVTSPKPLASVSLSQTSNPDDAQARKCNRKNNARSLRQSPTLLTPD